MGRECGIAKKIKVTAGITALPFLKQSIMKENTIIRKIGNDIENIFSNRNINIEDYEDILLNSHIKDPKGYIYRLDVNEDGTIMALEDEEDFTLTLDELAKPTLLQIEDILSEGTYTIVH